MDLFGFSTWPTEGWDLLERLRRDVDELFERRSLGRGLELRSRLYPPVNLYETQDHYVLNAEIPGVRQEDLEVTIEGNRVTLRGERKIEYPEDAETSLHRRERQSGMFRRTVELPGEADSKKAEAVHRHGILMVKVPKTPERRPRQIQVSRS